jgi:hypothetical protein
MQEYEVICKYVNGCAGEAYPITTFEEVELTDTDSYIRHKHGGDFDKFTKEIRSDGQIIYTYRSGVTYIYEFNPL